MIYLAIDTYSLLQHYWWLVVALLGALLVTLLFVQGGQSMLAGVHDKGRKALMIGALGHKWELTYTTLVTFGGAFFAAFPLFYAVNFGGAYWLWMFLLLSFVIQAVSYEYRSKAGNVWGTRFYDTLLLVNGVLGPVLLGVVVGGLFFGNSFTVTRANVLNATGSAIVSWGPWHGLEAIASVKNLLFGLMVLMLSRTLASLYFIGCIDDAGVQRAQHRQLLLNSTAFVLLLLVVAALILTAPGVQIGEQGAAEWVEHKYLHNLLTMWWLLVMLVAGVALVLLGVARSLLRPQWRRGFWPSAAGTVLVVMSLLLALGYGGTAYCPSLTDVNSSLTIVNSSSSLLTLTVMAAVSLLIPFVAAYIAWAWRALR